MLNVIDALLDIACSKAVDCGGVVLLLYLTTTTDSKNFGIFIATEIRMTGTTYLNSRCLKERCLVNNLFLLHFYVNLYINITYECSFGY